jgi:hypothetical protein
LRLVFALHHLPGHLSVGGLYMDMSTELGN